MSVFVVKRLGTGNMITNSTSIYEAWLKWGCHHSFTYVGPAMIITTTSTTAPPTQDDLHVGFATQKVYCSKCYGYGYIQVPIGESKDVQYKAI